jgi:hypothetical protein
MDVFGDPAAMRAGAARLRMQAESVTAMAARVSVHAEGMVYAGPAADRFRAAMRERDLRARRVASRLHQMADVLARAAGVEEERLASRSAEEAGG